jgi:hypothetical protein
VRRTEQAATILKACLSGATPPRRRFDLRAARIEAERASAAGLPGEFLRARLSPRCALAAIIRRRALSLTVSAPRPVKPRHPAVPSARAVDDGRGARAGSAQGGAAPDPRRERLPGIGSAPAQHTDQARGDEASWQPTPPCAPIRTVSVSAISPLIRCSCRLVPRSGLAAGCDSRQLVPANRASAALKRLELGFQSNTWHGPGCSWPSTRRAQAAAAGLTGPARWDMFVARDWPLKGSSPAQALGVPG